MSQVSHSRVHIFSSILLAVFAGIALQGCGSSGSSSSAPAAVTLSWSAQQTKTFHFTWADVSGETDYRLFENPDGASGFTQVGNTIAADSTSYDLVVSLPKRINAQYMLQSCNDIGCTDSNIVSFTDTLVGGIGYFKASNLNSGENFGFDVAFSGDGDTLAVGARNEGTSGAVYLFRNDNGTWQEAGYVKASNAGSGDWFGVKVALSADGTILAVGAYYEDGDATGVNTGAITETAQVTDSGAVYLFSNDGSSSVWTEEAYIKAPTQVASGLFGMRVALTANTTTQILAVSGDIQSGGNGAVYLFSNDGTGWVAGDILTASNGGADDCFGCQISLTTVGTTMIMAVGAQLEDGDATGVTTGAITETTPVSNSGAVYLFSNSFNGSVWTGWNQDAYIKASNTGTTDDRFGVKVALSADGTTLAVGANGEGENVTGVHVGDYTTNADGARGSGAVYLFNNNGSGWMQAAYIKASNTGYGYRFGDSVALSADGSTLAVGATNEQEDVTGVYAGDYSTNDNAINLGSGAAYLFSNSSGSWVQQAYIKASNTGESDRFGISIALTPDGDTLAVGAEYEDSVATGINSTETGDTGGNDGAVYLY
jgi:trimeric autotransporter adhesin